MKKLLLIVLCTLFIVSCSNKKTVVISGKVVGGSPLERIEIINTSDAAPLPIANFGVDAQGNFSDTIQIPKNGVYTLSYGGNYGSIYLKEHLSPNKNIWCYTGYTYEELMENYKQYLLEEIDVLIDGKFDESLKDLTLKLRGSSNQRIIDTKQSISKGEIILYDN